VNFFPQAAEISSLVWGTPANVNNDFRVLPLLLQWRRSPEANQTLHDVWLSPGRYTIYTVSGALAPWENFARCSIHFMSKSCVFLCWQHYCAALQQRASAKLRHGTRSGITELSQRVPPIFGGAVITLGIGPHSSLNFCYSRTVCCWEWSSVLGVMHLFYQFLLPWA